MPAQTELILSTVVKGTETATKQLNSVKSSIDGIGKEAKETSSLLSSIGGGLVKFGAIAGTALAGVGAVGLKMAGDFEQTSIAFKTMLGDGKKASELLTDLSKFAAETPFEFPEIASAGKSLLAFGFSAKDVKSTLQTIGDVASSLNIPLGELSEIYGKIKTNGRVFAEDINQLTGRGIPIIAELAKQFGVSEDKIRGMVEKGKIGFPEIQKAMESMTSEGGRFAGGMENQSKSLNGLLSTAKDNLGNILREIIGINMSGEVVAGSILEKAKNLTTAFIDFTNKNKGEIKVFLDTIMETFRVFFSTLFEILKKGFEIIQSFWKANGEQIKATVSSVTTDVLNFWTKYGNDIMIVLNIIGFTFARAFDGIKLIVQSVMFIIGPLVHDTMTAIGGAIQILAGILTGDFSKAWQGVKDLISGIIQVLGDIVLGFVDLVARAFGTDIVSTINTTIDFLTKKAKQAKEIVSDILSGADKAIQSFGGSFNIQGVAGAISGKRANGGPVGSGQSYLVGERGPEIFTPSSSGQIIPNNRIGGVGNNIVINITGMFGSDAADEIGKHIISRLKGASYV